MAREEEEDGRILGKNIIVPSELDSGNSQVFGLLRRPGLGMFLDFLDDPDLECFWTS
ncbi:hypothetical protein C1645_817433 [Glomus cerebriforme]|uniref:Uncharacterized protein n=1 Tax=Glomus cerebriforme TaxID=658196 RepID=A0A397TES2_9GLOM|nr:hypothetical protein C1645_817433 [Glomus cerebriforme]